MSRGKGPFVAFVALAVAAVGVIIALAAYFKNRSNYLYDDDDFLFDDPEKLAYYNTSHGEEEREDLEEPAQQPAVEPTPLAIDDSDEMALSKLR